jgi:hypothetical protein
MNRSILIVICDFLLVSLLAFSTVDINNIAVEGGARDAKPNIANNLADSAKDLTAVMRLALDEERRGRDQLIGELNQTRAVMGKQEALLTERDQQALRLQEERAALQRQFLAAQTNIQNLSQSNEMVLTEKAQLQQEVQAREQQSRMLEQQLQAREDQARLLEREVQNREQQAQRLQEQVQNREEQARRFQEAQAILLQQFLASQTNLQTLNQQLMAASTDSVISKEKLAAMEAEVRKQTQQAAAMQQQMNVLARSNQLVLTEKQQLATQLQVADVETRNAREQASRMQEQVKVEREEKAKLTEGFTVLARKSTELAQEMRVTRPLAPNTIFNDFVTNRVRALFSASRSGWFGSESTRRTETSSILVSDGTNIFALCHVEDTPVSLGYPGTEWEQLIGTLGRNGSVFSIRSMSFYLQDPRVVLIPVTAAEAKALGGKVYKISSDPYKFQDAVLVGAREGYYGECSFQIDLARQKDYLQMDRNSLKGFFGKFNPSRGDLVFSKAGELVGVMANNTYCVLIHNFDSAATFRFGQNVPQHTGEVLSQLYSVVAQLPTKLQ